MNVKDSIYLAIARIVEKHGLVSGAMEEGGEGAAVGAMIVKIIRVRLVRLNLPLPKVRMIVRIIRLSTIVGLLE